MIRTYKEKACYCQGRIVPIQEAPKTSAKPLGMAQSILKAHNISSQEGKYAISFDELLSHDITYVSIVQTARASGLTRFPVPYSFTNCHNSLCAIGGTINADDHRFGLSAAIKYGANFVPPNMAVIHQYAREMVAAPGKMVMASDSHTRYGALGCLGVGEGGGELVKQVLSKTWNIDEPTIIGIYVHGEPRPGVGPHDVAIATVTALFPEGYAKNCILEFVGPGIATLPMDYRMGIDVMTTETGCLSSVWVTDETVRDYLAAHGREAAYREMAPEEGAMYDKYVDMDLGAIKPMIALPFHPSLGVTIEDFTANVYDHVDAMEQRAQKLLSDKYKAVPNLKAKIHDGHFRIDQAVVSGCCGGLYGNLATVAAMLKGKTIGCNGINYSLYPASQPVLENLLASGAITDMVRAGATIRTAFCGPCFGAGDVPGQNCFSVRHVTRNFANREGSKAAQGQISYVALMDARSITATMLNNGFLTAAGEDTPAMPKSYAFDPGIYERNVYHGFGHEKAETELTRGPNIADWPNMIALPENLLLTVGAALFDKVTTTDDFIASGEPSAFRSNPGKMAEYTLRSKDAGYVARVSAIRDLEYAREAALEKEEAMPKEVTDYLALAGLGASDAKDTGIGSLVFAIYPGDGSAREQAASCQKVLGGWANIAGSYATKRYRSNCINWGILPLVTCDDVNSWEIATGDLVYLRGIRSLLEGSEESMTVSVFHNGTKTERKVALPDISKEERAILLSGCLINYYK